jgi:hypothetical protein
MNNIEKGLVAGLLFGIVSIIPMFFMSFENKNRAMVASFVSRFAIGFIIFNLQLPIPGWLKGASVGFILSLPDAIITKKYSPVLALGLIGGLVCGLFAK